MFMFKRRTVCLCLALLLLLPMVLTGCSKEVAKVTLSYTGEYDPSVRYYGDNGLIAENDNFQLLWDDGAQCALLFDKVENKWYGTTPYDYYMAMPDNITADYEMYNPIKISYIKTDEDTSVSNIAYLDASYDVIYDGNVVSEPIENGVSITYYFADVEIAVTLELTLTENGIRASVPVDQIQENKNKVFEVSVLPYMVASTLDTDSYLMVPSGGGALIDAKTLTESKSYSEAVYGSDLSEPVTMIKHSYDQAYLPVFGAKDRDNGMLGVITEGASCAYINAYTGDGDIGYATAYASFRIRGQEEILYDNAQSQQENVATSYSEEITNSKVLAVEYMPLNGDVTYVGMANRYRQYLQSVGYLQDRVESAPALSVNFLGTTQTQKSFFGIPYKSDTATTTLQQTKAIAEELKTLVGDDQLLVTLLGYGKGGLANTTVGGGFKLSSQVGSKKDWNALLEYAANSNIVLAQDYELVKFQKAGSGFTVNNAASYSLSQLDAKLKNYILSTAVEDDEGDVWYLLSRGRVAEAVQKAIESAKKQNATAISLGSLSNVAYSDYREESTYAAKSDMDTDVEEALRLCAENGLTVVANKANAYAAVNADYITEIPMRSSKQAVLSSEIPFYALVFQGYKNLTSVSINTAANVRDTYLQAVATGLTLQFTLCDTLHDSVQFEQDTAYITSRYAAWKDDITAMVNESADLHKMVGDQAIVQYTVENGVSTTVFENGVTVYVNYTNDAVSSPMGEIPAQSFVYG